MQNISEEKIRKLSVETKTLKSALSMVQNKSEEKIRKLYVETIKLKSEISIVQKISVENNYNNQKILTMQNATGGSVYVRWGRSTCSSGAELVYAGECALIPSVPLIHLQGGIHLYPLHYHLTKTSLYRAHKEVASLLGNFLP